MFAASKAGLILVNVNPNYKVHELEYCLNKVQMKAIIAARGMGKLNYHDHFLELFPDLAKGGDKKIRSKRYVHKKLKKILVAHKFVFRMAVLDGVEKRQVSRTLMIVLLILVQKVTVKCQLLLPMQRGLAMGHQVSSFYGSQVQHQQKLSLLVLSVRWF